MSDHTTVWVAEAYTDGERVERIVHTTEGDAWEDVEVCAPDADEYDVAEERVYTGAAE